jgi:hypothetical protein
VNKYLLIKTVSVFIFILLLSACGSTSEIANTSGDNNSSSPAMNSSDEVPLQTQFRPDIEQDFPLSARLGFGTLMLEDTEYAVSPSQAAELLPLWKAAGSLSQSETTAEAEIEAVFNQIQETMTAEQMAAISEMQMNGEEMAQLMEDLGLSFGGGGFGNLDPELQATAQAARESGEGFPGGGFPGGGVPMGPGPGGPGGGEAIGGNLTPEQQATLEARREERGAAGSRFGLIFVDPLIELLEERAGE